MKEYLDHLSDADAAAVAAGMKQVAVHGNRVARRLRGEILEVRVAGDRRAFRILFATEGREDQVLLALVAFAKATRTTPGRLIDLAERRLADWRTRGRS